MTDHPSFDQLMGQFGDAFDNQEASEMGSDLPDGPYIGVITKCHVNNAKSSGRLQVSWDVTVVWDPQGSKYKNRHAFFHDGITQVDKQTGKHSFSDMGVGILKKRFKILGMPNVTQHTIGDAVTRSVGRVVAFTQKSKKDSDFVNYYFDGLVAENLDAFVPPANAAELKTRLSSKPTSAPASLPTQPQKPSGPPPTLQFEE